MYGVAFSHSPFASQSEIAIVVDSVNATSNTGTLTVTGDCNLTLTGVVGTSAVGSPTIIEGTGVTFTLTGAVGTGAIGLPVVSADANLTISTGVSATSAVNDVTVTAAAVVDISTPQLIVSTNNVAITENNFDYESIRDSYDRTRVVYINETSQRFTVFIPSDLKDRTIHIAPLDRDNTIRIAA
tara:strand:+ start:790 stop:1341 length:552 start_codon:yes stop_codon:yes gene_type:complete